MGMSITHTLNIILHADAQEVVSTLLEAGFTPKKLGESAVNILADHLETLSRKHSGLISFCKSFF